MNHLFTIICEYKGGTYTKQVRAETPVLAFRQWAGLFQQEDVLSAAEKRPFEEEVQHSISEGNMVALEGLQNVWYEGFSLEDDLLEVMVVGMSGEAVIY